jgi:hypothetical protein
MKNSALMTLLIVTAALTLVACGAPAAAVEVAGEQEGQQPAGGFPDAPAQTLTETLVDEQGAAPGPALTETLVDEQGAVTVAVRPLNVGPGASTLDFEVSLDTHSVDLSMDLAGLATLTTDTGRQVSPLGWEAPQGGHHVSGVLSFPAQWDGADLLDGAALITLALENVAAPSRTFTWALK